MLSSRSRRAGSCPPLLAEVRRLQSRLRRFEDFALVPSSPAPAAEPAGPDPDAAFSALKWPPADLRLARACARSLEESGKALGEAAAEARLFGTPVDAFIRQAASVLREGGRELEAAARELGRAPDPRAGALVQARKAFLYVEGLTRKGLAEQLQGPSVVRMLKTRELYRRLSDAAAHGVEATDRLAELLVRNP
ncbi:MAG: hypothetical protein WC969_10580 [Elusimicrobiota bacterium]